MTLATVSALWVANCGNSRSRAASSCFDASHIAKVGHRLAGEHRIVGKPALLGALDLGVPVRALDQADRQPAPRCGGNLLDPIDDGERALLIGLHREAKTVPVAQRSVAQHGSDDFERQFEPVGLLGIDGELQIAVTRQLRELDERAAPAL